MSFTPAIHPRKSGLSNRPRPSGANVSTALAQKRIATRHRPTKSDEIDLFSGLLFCGDCGYKMYLSKGAGTPERKHAYTCGNYRNRARNDFLCTRHYIRKSVLKELVLANLQRIMSYVKGREQEFIRTATECSEQAMKKALGHQRKELDKAEARLGEINLLFRRLYEDHVMGKLSAERFAKLSEGYETEQAGLKLLICSAPSSRTPRPKLSMCRAS